MEELPRQTVVYKLDPEVYDKFIADLETPLSSADLEKTAKLFLRQSPFTRECD